VPQAGLSVHTASLVDVPALVSVWLLAHAVHAEQEVALVCVLKVPALQAAH